MKTAAPVVTERAPAKISCEFAKLIFFLGQRTGNSSIAVSLRETIN